MRSPSQPNRSQALQVTAGTAAAAASTLSPAMAAKLTSVTQKYDFDREDSMCLGEGWESLNPGYWQIKDRRLRRRLGNVGDRARSTGFPFHYANNRKQMEKNYDPSLPVGIAYRRDWKSSGNLSVTGEFIFKGDRPSVPAKDQADWKMYQDGYGFMGLAIGAKSLFESYKKVRHAIQIGWSDDGRFTVQLPANLQKRLGKQLGKLTEDVGRLRKGDVVSIGVDVVCEGNKANVVAVISINETAKQISFSLPASAVHGFVGIAGRGLIDFEVASLTISGQKSDQLVASNVEC